MRRLTIKHSAIAYILNREMGYTQSAIAKLMGVSQGTVSNMIKEFESNFDIKDKQEGFSLLEAVKYEFGQNAVRSRLLSTLKWLGPQSG